MEAILEKDPTPERKFIFLIGQFIFSQLAGGEGR